MAKKNQNLDEILTSGKELIKFYREHPCTAAYELLGVDLAPIQRLVFRDMWFKNYVIAVCGRGFGKTFLLGVLASLSALLYPGNRIGLIGPVFRQCLPIITNSYDTFWTSSGLVTGVDNFYNSIELSVTKTQSFYSQNSIVNKWRNKKQPCISITTERGFSISGSVGHKVKVCDKELNFSYKTLESISEGDYVVIKKGFNYFGNSDFIDTTYIEKKYSRYIGDIKLPCKLNRDLSYFLGLICGDGYIENEDVKRRFWQVGFCSKDIELLDDYERILLTEFNIPCKRVKVGNYYKIEVNSIVLWNYIKLLGMSSRRAADKVVPNVIKKASKSNVTAFVSGLMDTDGNCSFSITKSGYRSGDVNLVSTSKQLCKEVQSIFLNIGILSSFSIKQKKFTKYFESTGKFHECKECYRLRISGRDNIDTFYEHVGFRLTRKTNKLLEYIQNFKCDNYNSVLPNTFSTTYSLANKCLLFGEPDVEFLDFYINKYKKYRKSDFTVPKINELLSYCESKAIVCDEYYKLKNIITMGLWFFKLTVKEYFEAETIDIEVENEHCYWTNGFINHNSKMIFSEVEKLYDASAILREAVVKQPIRGSDVCYLKFKSVAGKAGSYIEALPLGADGGKIRGSRFYVIVVDELAQVPTQTLDLVVRPMSATALAPMERVRRIEEQERLIKAGLATPEDFKEEKVNKMIMTTSGYYKFNHMWKRMKDHWRQMDADAAAGKESPYSVWQVPYWDLPSGFLDMPNIEEARRIMSRHEFRMEYEAAMVSDSEGFFKASLLEECTLGSGFGMNLTGGSGNHIIGVDPNQGGADSCGIVVLEIGRPNKIVNVVELKKHTTQGLTKAVQELSIKYNTVRIYMDKGGGGKAVMDLLEEGYNEAEPILDRTNPDNEQRKGRHILEMVNFNPAWISDANFTTKAMLEDKTILFPELDPAAMDTMARAYETIITLKSQLLNIVVTQTATGILHFDTPSKDMHKDLYSALILAAHGARMMEKELEEDEGPFLYQASGMIRPRGVGATFTAFNGAHQQSGNIITSAHLPFGSAVLERNKKK